MQHVGTPRVHPTVETLHSEVRDLDVILDRRTRNGGSRWRGAETPESRRDRCLPVADPLPANQFFHPHVSGLLRMPIAACGAKVGRDDQGAFDGKPIRRFRRCRARIRGARPDTPLPWLNVLGQDDLFSLVHEHRRRLYVLARRAAAAADALPLQRYSARLGRALPLCPRRRHRLESRLEADEDAPRSL